MSPLFSFFVFLMSDFSSILDRARSGNEDAIRELYNKSYDRVYAFLYHRTLDTQLTEDIISDVYLKVIQKSESIRATTEGEFFSWIFRIAYTTLIDTIRSQKPHDSLDEMLIEPGHSRDIALDIDNKNTLQEVMTFLETLSERDRTILTLRIWDDLSYDEISEITGESVANAKQIVSRSLARIAANVPHLFFLGILGSIFKI